MKIFFLFLLFSLNQIAGHEATTVVKVHPKFIVAGELKAEDLFAREKASIVAPTVLEKAVFSLNPKLAREETALAISDLKKQLTVKQRKGTRLIEITVEALTFEEARRISNAVADEFIAYRKEVKAQRVKEVLAALDAKIDTQSKLADKDNKDLINFIKQFGIPLADPKGDLEKLNRTIEQLKEAEANERLAIMAKMDLAINTVTEPHRQYLQDLETVKSLRKKHRPQHPTLVAAHDRLIKSRDQVERAAAEYWETIKLSLVILKKNQQDPAERVRHVKGYQKALASYRESRDKLIEMKINRQKQQALFKRQWDPISIYRRPWLREPSATKGS